MRANFQLHTPIRRGAVMSETVLVLPIVLVVLVLLLFYGWSLTRYQKASVQDRYATWRQVYHARGPRVTRPPTDPPDAASNPPGGPGNRVNTDQINQTFWGDNAQELTYVGSDGFPDQPRERLSDEASNESDEAGQLADSLLNDHLPDGRTVGFNTQLSSFSAFVDELNIPLKHRHTRMGNEWKFVNAVKKRDDDKWVEYGYRLSPQTALRDVFFEQLDRRLERIIDNQPDNVSRVVRWYYLGKPQYRGPDVDYQFRD